MNIKGTLPIDQVLYMIKTNGGKPLKIRFVRSTGQKAGSIKECLCIYGAKDNADKVMPTKTRKSTIHKINFTIPLISVMEGNKPITPLISHIIGYEDYIVRH
jgi:hypothetical protein